MVTGFAERNRLNMKNKTTFVLIPVRVKCMCLNKEEHAHPAGRSKNLIRFLQSFVILPVLAASVPLGSLAGIAKTEPAPLPQAVLAERQNVKVYPVLAVNQVVDVVDEKAQTLTDEGKAIDAYFEAHNMPLRGTGAKMAEEADKNGLDWRLIPAIAVRESTGGKHACQNVANSFLGWGGCKISFKSKDEAIEVVARNLGGNNPNTEHHYSGKTTKAILEKYNPPEVVAKYADQVMAIMDAIGDENMSPAPLAVANT